MRQSRIAQNRILASQQNNPDHSQSKQTQRILRHEKLIQMVKKYRRSIQQDEKLYRMKKNVQKDIQLRYNSTPANNSYIFPRKQSISGNRVSDDNDEELLNLSKNIYYDLHTQNVQKKHVDIQSQSNRRAKSLDQVLSNAKSERVFGKTKIIEINLHNYQNLTIKHSNNLIRSNSVKKQEYRHKLVLPQLRKNVQIMKTEQTYQPSSIQRILKKKLITQSNSPLKVRPKRMQSKPTQKYWRKDYEPYNV